MQHRLYLSCIIIDVGSLNKLVLVILNMAGDLLTLNKARKNAGMSDASLCHRSFRSGANQRIAQ